MTLFTECKKVYSNLRENYRNKNLSKQRAILNNAALNGKKIIIFSSDCVGGGD